MKTLARRLRGIAAAALLAAVVAVWGGSLLLGGVVAIVATAALIVFAALGELHRAQEELRLVKEELKARVEERTDDLRLSVEALRQEVAEREKAEQALSAKAEELARSNLELASFAATASHDLQAPLRKVGAFAARLGERMKGGLDPESADYLQRIQRAVTTMDALVENLLCLARVTARAKALAEVDLTAVAREALGDLEASVAQSGGRVDLGRLPRLRADALQMKQLLQNLLSNALKFRKKDIPPLVRVSGRYLDNGFCELTVTDNGIGFEEARREQIFKPFQRLHSRSEYEGCGLGLAICSAIVMRHGGAISARGFPGEGAAFTVTLPTPYKAQPQSRSPVLEVPHGAAH